MVIHTILIASIAWIMSVSIYLGQVGQKKSICSFYNFWVGKWNVGSQD